MSEEAKESSETRQERKQEKRETKRERPRSRADDNVIFVGKKPTMSYVLAVVTQFSAEGCNEVHVKARGRSISHAVDIAEVVKNRFFQSMKRNVEIGTEEVQDKEGKRLKVSTIDITLRK